MLIRAVYLYDSKYSSRCFLFIFFFFNDTATTEIYTLSLHDALPISDLQRLVASVGQRWHGAWRPRDRKSTRLNSSHGYISYAVFCLKKKKKLIYTILQLNINDIETLLLSMRS